MSKPGFHLAFATGSWTNKQTNKKPRSWRQVTEGFHGQVVVFRGLIHETDLRAKLRPKYEVRNYRRKVAINESGQREVAT